MNSIHHIQKIIPKKNMFLPMTSSVHFSTAKDKEIIGLRKKY